MDKYDPYNPNNLDELFNKKKINENKNNDKKNIDRSNKDNKDYEDIGMNILKKMGWKGKGIIYNNIINKI